ncbi:MAG: GTPase HflX [Desulfovibrionales bacterium]
MALLTADIGRQIGLLIDRQGRPAMVLVGTPSSILIPELTRYRQKTGRLLGMRFLHTHLKDEVLSQEDLMDLVFLRLDSIGLLSCDHVGMPAFFTWAHLLPPNAENLPYRIHPPTPWDRIRVDHLRQIQALEEELARTEESGRRTAENRAILVSVGTEPKNFQERSLDELAELCRTAGLTVADRLIQRVARVNPKHILGKGKLADLEVLSLQHNASILVFQGELSPTQMRNLAEITERKVLDRTQLILDIFAQHAVSRAGKLQVEMAQLQYTLPRLVGQNRALSRLAGGIGGRGPGETKLELDRRKIRNRMAHIRRELDRIRKHRSATRARRAKVGLPIVSLVGYTNAGKSTLLNVLSDSEIPAEDKLFATLDPTSRRVRFPEDQEIIITDTVGFIRELPEELREAFMATLEELGSADLLVQVADAGHPELEDQVAAVDSILQDLDLGKTPRILALNKWDRLDAEQQILVGNVFPQGIPISALHRDNLKPLVQKIQSRLPLAYSVAG